MPNSFTVHLPRAQLLDSQQKVRGALNFWKLQGAELDEALRQLTDAQIKKMSTKLLHNN